MSENPGQLRSDEQETSQEAVAGGVSSWVEALDGFDGNQTTKLDERGRLKMPLEFRAFIEKKYGKGFHEFHITSMDGSVAELYPMPEWVKRKSRMLAMSQSSEALDRFEIHDNLYGAHLDMDPQGRLQIPPELREDAELFGEVKVYGSGKYLRITSVKKLRDLVKAKPILPQHKDEMKAQGC
jgi:MraZ protein